jgi:hypothetical protein
MPVKLTELYDTSALTFGSESKAGEITFYNDIQNVCYLLVYN